MQDKLSTLSLPEARLARILRCTASDVLRWAGLYEQATAETDAIGFGMRRVQAEQTLLHEGQRFENVYLVGGGSFKHVQTDLEGYEQVLGFATHGDMLGLDGLGRDVGAGVPDHVEPWAATATPVARWRWRTPAWSCCRSANCWR